jgi:phosphomannomutase
VGAAFADEVAIADGRGAAVVGRDVRATSPALSAAVIAGITGRGADVVDIGLAATDLLYFASGRLDLPGVMVTASHNPAGWNGLKLCRAGVRPIGRGSGLDEVRARATERLARPRPPAAVPGRVEHRPLLSDYADHVRGLVPVRGRRLRVVVDAANAMAALTVPAVLAPLDVEVVPLYFELDGRFPNHPADPLDAANLVPLRREVVTTGADLGLAFDGDADRCFVLDERGELVEPSLITALIAERELSRHPGAVVIHNAVCSRIVPEVITAAGGVAVRTPVGHSIIKAAMAEQGAVFGGEHSGHFYFRDFWYADSGMLAALHVLAALAAADRPLSRIAASYRRYVTSGEINSAVPDPETAMRRVERRFHPGAAERPDGEVLGIDHLDGLTVTAARWWFNLRASNTEPLVRLNVEAQERATMEEVRDSVLATLRSDR